MTTAAKSIARRVRVQQRARRRCRASTWRRFARDFPILRQKVRGKPLVYLDNAATSQKPQAVIDAIARYYERGQRQHSSRRAFPFRARHRRARSGAQNGAGVPECRRSARNHLRARRHRSHQPGGANLRPRSHVGAGDEVLITAMEHHSNIVPWQILCEEKGAKLRVAPINDRGELMLDEFDEAARPADQDRRGHARFERAGHDQSRAQDDRNGARENIPVLVDGAQAVPHIKVDVQDAGLRFLRLLRPQGVRAHRDRRALRQSGTAGGHAALPGRRRHDQFGHLREDDLQQAALQI